MRGRVKASNPRYLDPIYIESAPEHADKVLGAGQRHWQLDILKMFADERWCSLTAPCGSGKSTAQVGLAIEDVLRSNRLQLFVVPQTHISAGFFKADGVYDRIEIGKTVYTVAVDATHNFCEDSSLIRLKALLLADRKTLAPGSTKTTLTGLFAMTSYQALALVWEQMTTAEKTKAAHLLHLRLDESHHVSEEKNKVGKVCRFIMESKDKTNRITLSTATNFRGDNARIFTRELAAKFKNFTLDWIDHWKTIGIRDMFMEIAEFDGDPIKKIVKAVASEKNEKHYIVVPPRTSGWRARKQDDSAGIDELIQKLQEACPKARILDLVDDDGRVHKKDALINEPKYRGEIDPVTGLVKESKFDIIITCMLGREGTDWCPCSRLHVSYVEGSLTLAVQTLGRLLRRFDGKTVAKALYYYPRFPEPKEGLSKAELLEDRKNALLLMTQCEEMFFPILFPPMPGVLHEPNMGNSHRGDWETTHPLQHDMGAEYLSMKADFLGAASEQGMMGMSVKDIRTIIDQVLDSYDIDPELLDKARRTLEVVYLRDANPMFAGITIAFVRENGFEKLYSRLSYGDRTLLFSHNEKRMKELRAIVQKSWDEMYAKIKATIRKASDWELPANKPFKNWMLLQKDRMANKANKANAKSATVGQ